jgi:putative drug exporter of the RND superfamily
MTTSPHQLASSARRTGQGSSALPDVPPTGAITFWIPLMVFALLFGPSMDYAFPAAHAREEYDRTGSTEGVAS